MLLHVIIITIIDVTNFLILSYVTMIIISSPLAWSFDTVRYTISDDLSNSYTIVFTIIDNKKVTTNTKFIHYCKYIGIYLKYIKENGTEHINACCKYFSYELNDILKSNEISALQRKKFYQIMKNVEEYEYNNVFYTCSDHIEDLDEGIFYVMKNLNDLYFNFDKLKDEKGECEYDTKCFEKYSDIFRTNQKLNIKSFRDYSVYGSYIVSVLNNLKGLMSKYSKNYDKLMDSFERTYKNLIHDNNLIAYKSLNF
ncbi:variable surface protein [Plasmodium gonderi]|uniref:Variable surface protein n=1 Tax=Plasmodium gonderi TaxID=77519 RepID=A0A1Y1JP56_PLAGO|nr:variable surface protein [Plasmodium gonderi]GAW84249.1 variable surface protein [Plasmodium gonderi]